MRTGVDSPTACAEAFGQLRRIRRSLTLVAIFVLAVAATSAATAPLAQAAVQVTSLTVSPNNPTANSSPNLTVSMNFAYTPSSDDIKRLTITLPPGLVGNPNAVTKCTTAQFSADSCPSGSDVGDTTVRVVVDALGMNLDASGDVYNLQPQSGEPARLGVIVRPPLANKIFLTVPVAVRPDLDFALENRIDNLPRTTYIPIFLSNFDVTITSMSLTLNGMVGGQRFLTMPSSCNTANLTVTAGSWDSTATATRSAPITPTGCASLAFNPSFAFTTQTTRAETPSGATAAITLPSGSPTLKRAVVTLPPGVAINPAAADGLAACSDAQFAADSNSAPACPSASRVGTVEFDTPLLGLLTGDVYFAQPTDARPWGLFVSISGPGFFAKLVGNVAIDQSNGQITTTFDDIPQVPFTAFRLTFNGGSKALLVTPRACGAAQAQAQLTPWSSSTPVARNSTVTISWDGAGAPCPSPRPFNPTLALTLSDSSAGASPAMTLTVTRPDRDQELGSLRVSLPPGLLGYLAMDGLSLCSPASAASGSCPASSRVGSVAATSGPGTSPVTLNGDVYLTSAPRSGAIAGLAVVIPARVGPVDLGRVVVTNALVLRTSDFGLVVESDRLPSALKGIPLAVRSLAIRLDRSGFLRNPTRCGTLQAAATIAASDGRTADRSVPLAISGCDRLPFAPALTGSVGARDNFGSSTVGVPLTTRITLPSGNAALKRARVQLPSSILPSLDALSRACPVSQIASGTCPPNARVGTARVVTPLLPITLEAPVLLAENAGGLPRLAIPLLGTVLYGDVSLAGGRVTTTFDNLPDIPLASFELAIDGGPSGLLRAPNTICVPNDVTTVATLDAHSGRSLSVTKALERPTCTAPRNAGGSGGSSGSGGSGGDDRTSPSSTRPSGRASVVVRRGRATVVLRIRQPRALAALARVRAVLPRSLTPRRGVRPIARTSKRIARKYVRLRGRTVQVRLVRSTRSVLVRITQVRVSRSVQRALARRKRPVVRIAVTVVDRKGRRWRITVSTRARRA